MMLFSLFLLCGGNLSLVEAEGVLSSGIFERLCTRIESESSELDVLPTLLVLDRLCCGLNEVIETKNSKPTDQDTSTEADLFSLTRRCEFALARIETAVLVVKKNVGGQRNPDKKTKEVQKEVGGMLVRHFQSSIQSSKKEIGEIGIDFAAVRREMETEREKERREMEEKMRKIEVERDKDRKEREKEKREMEMREKEREMAVKKAEEERQREFSRKMREMEEMKRMNEELIEEGRQRREEKKREAERKRKEEEERRRNVKEGAVTIEVFARDKFTVARNVIKTTEGGNYHILSHSFGAVVVRITFIIRAIGSEFDLGLISADLTEKAKTGPTWFMDMKGGAGWACHSSFHYSRQNGQTSHKGTACKVGAVGQRVVLEADGREGKRTLKLSQDGETQPAFFSNIPVPFRFVVLPYFTGNSVEIVSSEVLKEASMVGGRLEVVMS
ncbi:hypothetical protein BLNAU_15255 [Blattamonas nauphoetae]|uniref:Uncharacterized protein n=1 Tax=Blattamonas nauphoetae TaxID=2049346 RepID=A0ABQ9XF60_9EUKA|nr:hypothetical protein BLNAU_15255 [Blattamonas nauphoetae]